jgi:4-aminobutyrate aminotransferase/(S)-3-amino-2-methylpropionate transaminase
VTFSKKMQAAGVFHNLDTRPNAPYRNYNTWMVSPAELEARVTSSDHLLSHLQGDPMRAIQAQKMLEIIKDNKLVEHTKKTGDLLYGKLEQLFKAYPQISGLRGKNNGTFIAWDFPSPKHRDAFVSRMRANGVQMGGCGDKSVSISFLLILVPALVDNACSPSGPIETDVDVWAAACRCSAQDDGKDTRAVVKRSSMIDMYQTPVYGH